MSSKKIAIFGSKESLGLAHVKDFIRALNGLKHELVLLPDPKVLQSFTKWKELSFDWMIFVSGDSKVEEAFHGWPEVLAQLQQRPLFASWTAAGLPSKLRAILKPDFEFQGDHSKPEVLESLGLKGPTEIKSEHFLSDLDLSLVELSEKVSKEGETGLHTAAFLEDSPSLSNMPASSAGSFEVENAGLEPVLQSDQNEFFSGLGQASEEPSLSDSSSASEAATSLDDLFRSEGEVQQLNSDSIPEEGMSFLNLDKASPSTKESPGELTHVDLDSGEAPSSVSMNVASDNLWSQGSGVPGNFDEEASFLQAIQDEVAKSTSASGFDGKQESGSSLADVFEDKGGSESDSKAVESNSLNFSQDSLSSQDLSLHSSRTVVNVPSVKTSVKPVELNQGEDPIASLLRAEQISGLDPGRSVGDTEDMRTIKRYAQLKEREAREKSAALKALKGEFSKAQSKLQASEAERRRLALKVEELDVQLRTSLDKNEEHRHQFTKMEQGFQEQLKDLKIRLESAQFQASKFERKLEDFRDRVKSDIQKIRVRERELANRLELQKRDAEALLVVKDERLLQQKREIDRLQFEVDSLRDRLEEEIERSEDRSKRLGRVMQSLKLAQGMLSGLEDPVAYDTSSESGGDGEAA